MKQNMDRHNLELVNITTKSGQSYYNIFTDAVTSTKLDDYGYNLIVSINQWSNHTRDS